MKFGKLSKFIFGCLAASPLVCTPLSSCSPQIADEVVTVETKSLVTADYNFSINFDFHLEVNPTVYIQVMNLSTPAMWINGKVIDLKNNHGSINFGISDSIHDNSSFSFNIRFWYTDKNGKQHNYTIYNFFVYFLTEIVQDLDPIELDSRHKENTDNHAYEFTAILDNAPKSSTASIFIINDIHHKINLLDGVVEIVPFGNKYKITIPLELDLSVFQQNVFAFDIGIEFTNSFGENQRQIFYGCTIKFTKTEFDSIPEEYFDISKETNGNVILYGLKDSVSELEAGAYNTLSVPEGVTHIDDWAFTDTTWFNGINKLIIPSSVKSIDSKAFGGLTNLLEIDLTSYGEEGPEWADDGIKIFDHETLHTQGGYVWTGQWNDPNIKDYVSSWGLLPLWNGFYDEIISKPNDFTYASTTEQKIITGLNPQQEERWKHIKVIKLPDTTIKIQKNAFEKFKGEIPYESPDSTPENPIYETRRLVINEKLEEFAGHDFENAGISGPIIISSQQITELPVSTFSNITNYGWPGLMDVITEPLDINISHANNLELIEKFAFAFSPVSNSVLTLPVGVKKIDDFAFHQNKCETIVLNKYLMEMGLFAFGDAMSEPLVPHISIIDLACYDEIIDPSAKPKTMLPPWFDNADDAFTGNCKSVGTIIFSNEAWTEISEKDEPDEWLSDFKSNHGIPQAWKVETVTTQH